MTRRVAAWPLLLLLPLATGCLSIHRVDLREGLDRHQVVPVEVTEELSQRPMTVYVVAGQVLGGVVAETRDPKQINERGSYRSELFPLPENAGPREVIEERAENVDGVLCGLEVHGFAETLAAILRKRLGERFVEVEVRVVSSLEASEGIVVTAEAETYMEVIPTTDKKSLVRLSAELDRGGVLVTGEGSQHVHRGHLIWAVPTTIVSGATLGPPGIMAVQLGFISLEADAMEDSLVEAIDQAATKLAERLAEQPDQPVPLEFGEVQP